jgi:hypothetical protein
MEKDYNLYKTIVLMKDVVSFSFELNHPDTIEEGNTFFKITSIASRMTGTSKNFVKLCSNALASDKIYNTKLDTYNVLTTFPLTTSNTLTIYGDVDENSLGLPINSYLIQNPTIDLFILEEDYSAISSLTGVIEVEICVWKKKTY